jgi:hypothetical protein
MRYQVGNWQLSVISIVFCILQKLARMCLSTVVMVNLPSPARLSKLAVRLSRLSVGEERPSDQPRVEEPRSDPESVGCDRPEIRTAAQRHRILCSMFLRRGRCLIPEVLKRQAGALQRHFDAFFGDCSCCRCQHFPREILCDMFKPPSSTRQVIRVYKCKRLLCCKAACAASALGSPALCIKISARRGETWRECCCRDIQPCSQRRSWILHCRRPWLAATAR